MAKWRSRAARAGLGNRAPGWPTWCANRISSSSDDSVGTPSGPICPATGTVGKSCYTVGPALQTVRHLYRTHRLVKRLDRYALPKTPDSLFEWSPTAPPRVRRRRSLRGRSVPTVGGFSRPRIALFSFVVDRVSGTAGATPRGSAPGHLLCSFRAPFPRKHSEPLSNQCTSVRWTARHARVCCLIR